MSDSERTVLLILAWFELFALIGCFVTELYATYRFGSDEWRERKRQRAETYPKWAMPWRWPIILYKKVRK